MRKKLFLAATMALAMTAFAAPAFADDNADLQNLINNATSGTVTLDKDYTITDTIEIDDGITINGNGKTITYSGNGSALSITAQDSVELENLNVTAASSGAYAISLTSSQPDLSLTDCIIKADTRGINMYPVGGCTDGYLALSDTDILNSRITDYAEDTVIGDTRGIALYDVKESNIYIEDNSNIKGFGYSVNLTGSRDPQTHTSSYDGTTVSVTNSNIFGWTAFNVWSSDTIFNITGSHLRGINPSYGLSDTFATIVVNDDIYDNNDQFHADACWFNISNTTIDNFIPEEKLQQQAEDGAYTAEFLFRIDSQGVTRANMNNVTFKDNTDILICAFVAGNFNYTQEFHDYIMGTDGTGRFAWSGTTTSTYSDGTTPMPLVI